MSTHSSPTISPRYSPTHFHVGGGAPSSCFNISSKFQFYPPSTMVIQEGDSSFSLDLDTGTLESRVTQVGSVAISYSGDCVSKLGSLDVKYEWFSSKVASIGPVSIERMGDTITKITNKGQVVYQAGAGCTLQ